MKKTGYIIYLLTVMMTMAACSDTTDTILSDGTEQGEAIVFTTLMPDADARTRSAQDDWKAEVESYKAVDKDYTFKVEMWRQGDDQASGESTYKPALTEEHHYYQDGTLQCAADATPLYWQDNVHRWGFKATAGTEEISLDQSSQEKWLAQDKLVGYGYLPLWHEERYTADHSYHGDDDLNGINYHTNKEWYAGNKEVSEGQGIMGTPEDFKKIPLYMQHQRSWVTIILKAGEGVTREALAYITSAQNIKATIYNYKDGVAEPQEITPWPNSALMDYVSDKNGEAATGVSTTRYDAIIEPHNFIETRKNEESDVIARISVSNQNFSFAAANDFNYPYYIATGDSPENAAAKEAMQAYNLLPGKHLTITATLTRASRLILITAWIEDWTETVTQTICDDYGKSGTPITINNREELVAFLTDPEKNKAGNVGLIVPNILVLDDDPAWDGSNYTLKATLNLAGCQLHVKSQLVNTIERTGSIINGEVYVTDAFTGPTVIADTNKGTVERIRVTTSGELTPARASVAGLVATNYGTIYQCSSALPVNGTTGYVGGIAAQSLFSGDGLPPVIDACTVTARVDGSDGITAGGGIVGQAEGRVSNNTFEYGVTLLQGARGKFFNIMAAIGTNAQGITNHTNNSWPTTDKYKVDDSSVEIINSSSIRYDAVIDRQEELKELLKSAYNQSGKTYRVANSFSVDRENWIWGNDVLDGNYFAVNSQTTYANGTVKFDLNGNDKTIKLTGTTYATMLFGSIIGEVHDLNLILDKPIVADRIRSTDGKNDDTNTDAIAALAYAVTTAGEFIGKVSNVTLKAATDADNHTDVYIQSTTPGGITVWAMHGGELTNCVSNVPIRMLITTEGTDARHYAGGIVACAEKAVITQCKYYGGSGSIEWAADTDGSSYSVNAKRNNCRYGGIVGGTSEIPNSPDLPHLVLSDCYSWWDLPSFDQTVTVRPYMGSIIGSTVFHSTTGADQLFNAMAEGNAGNWWTGTVGAGLVLNTETEEKVIGKKNSMVPTKPQGW